MAKRGKVSIAGLERKLEDAKARAELLKARLDYEKKKTNLKGGK